MEDEAKTKTTPRFGLSAQTDFFTLLKKVVKTENPNIILDETKHHSKLNNSKNEKKSNSIKKFSLTKSPQMNKELAIERWFCDYPNKRLILRNDYDQDHSQKFLLEKEIAFEKLNFCDSLLMNNNSRKSN